MADKKIRHTSETEIFFGVETSTAEYLKSWIEKRIYRRARSGRKKIIPLE